MLDEMASMYGFDVLTRNSVDFILGASASFIDSKWLKIYLHLIANKHTLSHPTESVISNIQSNPARAYPDVNIFENIFSVVSDTVRLA